MSFNTKLTELLKTDQRLVDDEGELLIAAVQDRAWKIDRDLVKLLLSDKEIKVKFFEEIEGHWIFNINTFLEYISQKNFLDNSYTRFRNRIGLTIGEKYLRERGDVALVWPYKDTVLEGGQTKEEEKRKEIFFNEVLAQDEINRLLDPKVLTNFTRYAAKGKQPVKDFKRDKNGVICENLILKGNNLLALHTLKTQFRGQVKLIYIDPPFNTENDTFQYNDTFSQSAWFTFLKNRFEVARILLSKGGSIFVHIDQDNKHPVKMILDEVFGRENFRNEIILPGRAVKNLQQQFDSIKKLQVRHDTLFWYTKDSETSFKPYWVGKHDVGNVEGHWHHAWSTEERKTMQYELLGTKINKGQWVWSEKRALQAVDNYNRFLEEGGGRTLAEYWRDTGKTLSFIRKSPDDGKPQYWRAPADLRLGDTVWSGVPIASSDYGFKTAKNEKYLAEVINLASTEGDLILDFFAGSGTTMATAHKLNRRWIGVEQLEYVETTTLERLQKVIKGDQLGISKSVNWKSGGEFIYCELMKYNEIFMERIQVAKNSKELLKIWQDMAEGSFLNWYVNPEMPEAAVKDFEAIGKEENGFEKQKRLLAELLDKNQLYVNLSEIDDAQFKVSKEDKALNKAFYGEM